MLIRDMLQERTTLSFEFFPPKDYVGFWELHGTIRMLRSLSPDFVSVTRNSGRSRSLTTELTSRVKCDLGIESMAHLICMDSTPDEISRCVGELTAKGIKNILALRGDLPKDGLGHLTFEHASDMVTFLRAGHPDLCIGAACYPETHPDAPNAAADLDNLKRKVDAGVDFLITQLFFDNRRFLRFRDRADKAGINVPIIAGIMPILSAKQVERFAAMCGVSIPASLRKKIESVGDDTEALRHVGMFHATKQCLNLLRNGVAGLHFYTLNRSSATRAICQYVKSS